MLNTVKPVHINIGDGTAASGVVGNAAAGVLATQVPGYYAYEDVPAGTPRALKVTVPGMGAGATSTWSGGSGAASTGSRSPGRRATWITITNKDAVEELEISFDNGNNFFTIGVMGTFTAQIYFRHFFLRATTSSATNIQVECIVGINQT
jgi:hypothetical protein